MMMFQIVPVTLPYLFHIIHGLQQTSNPSCSFFPPPLEVDLRLFAGIRAFSQESLLQGHGQPEQLGLLAFWVCWPGDHLQLVGWNNKKEIINKYKMGGKKKKLISVYQYEIMFDDVWWCLSWDPMSYHKSEAIRSIRLFRFRMAS